MASSVKRHSSSNKVLPLSDISSSHGTQVAILTNAGKSSSGTPTAGSSPPEQINVYQVLNDEQIAEFRQAFKLFDKDNDGEITTDEIGTVMRHLGQEPTEEELQEIIKVVDYNGDGTIDFEEYLQMMVMAMKTTDGEDEIVAAFRMLDEHERGWVTRDQLAHILYNLEEDVTPAEAKDIIDDVDDGTGRIDYTLFVKTMLALSGSS